MREFMLSLLHIFLESNEKCCQKGRISSPMKTLAFDWFLTKEQSRRRSRRTLNALHLREQHRYLLCHQWCEPFKTRETTNHFEYRIDQRMVNFCQHRMAIFFVFRWWTSSTTFIDRSQWISFSKFVAFHRIRSRVTRKCQNVFVPGSREEAEGN